MRKIGVLYGDEGSFPEALVKHINTLDVEGVAAEHIKTGAVRIAEPSGYRVIIDRISRRVPFYHAYLKNAQLGGTTVMNNPFWSGADDKFFEYSLASRIGMTMPRTVILPHQKHPPGTASSSFRNLVYPLDWDAIFTYVGFPAYLKPYAGGGWRHVFRVDSRDQFFEAYHRSGTECMVLQQAIDSTSYYRCYVVGQRKVHVMRYDPNLQKSERYLKNAPPAEPAVQERMVRDALTLCKALGYEMNTVEFAVRDGQPYAVDFFNPVPEAELHLVGKKNFEWFVQAVAELAIEKALSNELPRSDYHWSRFLAKTAAI